MPTVNIGDRVKDSITGLEGIVMARTVWMYGCVRLLVQPQVHTAGKAAEPFTCDEPQLVVVERGAIQPAAAAGGPRDDAAAYRRWP
jgi:hypothetical protein